MSSDITEDVHDAELRRYTDAAEALKASLRRIIATLPAEHPTTRGLEAIADTIGRPLYYHRRPEERRTSGSCYKASWGWVHVRPGCRCPR